MKKYLNVYRIQLIWVNLYLICQAGLLDILMGQPGQMGQIYTRNNNQNVNNQATQVNAIPYNIAYNNNNNNNWRSPTALSKSREYINSMYGRGRDNTNNYQRRNLGIPFTNGNSNNNLVSPNVQPNSNYNNVPVNSDVIQGNAKGTNTNTNTYNKNANLPKIINDVKKINTIVNAINQRNGNGNTPGTGSNLPLIHINTGNGQDFEPDNTNNNNINNNNYQSNVNNGAAEPYISDTPRYNVPATTPPNLNYISDENAVPTTDVPKTNVISDGSRRYINNNTNRNPIISQVIDQSSPRQTYNYNNKNKEADRNVLKPLTKRKFFFQVQPVLPDYMIVRHNETIYYVN